MSFRKAQVHSQFNWLFVLIVGGFFIILFFTMSTRQADSAQQRISATALEGISNIFEAARTGTSMSATVDIPDIEIKFSCENELFGDNTYSEYRVGGFSRRIDALPTFAPGNLEGDNLVTWTQSWEMPFNVMNFLLITNEQTRFFFVKNDDFSDIYEDIENSFSDNMKVEFVDSIDDDRFADFNDDFSIVVLFSEDDEDPDDLDAIDETFSGFYRVVQITPDRDMFGTINFYEDAAHVSEIKYAGRASLYGALFSPDKEYYDCSMSKAMERFVRVSCIYNQKHRSLADYYSSDAQCVSVYDRVLDIFRELHGDDFCAQTSDGIELSDASIEIDEDYGKLKDFFFALESAYDDARRHSCARPY
ncbi:MAG: hypothetical protein ACLFTR_02170 [Candidatus Woesearchaeota archaeon]